MQCQCFGLQLVLLWPAAGAGSGTAASPASATGVPIPAHTRLTDHLPACLPSMLLLVVPAVSATATSLPPWIPPPASLGSMQAPPACWQCRCGSNALLCAQYCSHDSCTSAGLCAALHIAACRSNRLRACLLCCSWLTAANSPTPCHCFCAPPSPPATNPASCRCPPPPTDPPLLPLATCPAG